MLCRWRYFMGLWSNLSALKDYQGWFSVNHSLHQHSFWWTLYYSLYLHVSWSFVTWSQDRAVLKLHSDCLGKTWLISRIASTVQSTSIPDNNLTKDEQQVLKRMKNDTNIVVLLADKGHVTVVMEKADYFDKMDALLNLNLNIISSATSRGHHANSETLKW